MTTSRNVAPEISQLQDFFVFPDPPENPEDKMTNFDHLAGNGNARYLAIHLGNSDAESELSAESESRIAAESRVRELEEQLGQRDS